MTKQTFLAHALIRLLLFLLVTTLVLSFYFVITDTFPALKEGISDSLLAFLITFLPSWIAGSVCLFISPIIRKEKAGKFTPYRILIFILVFLYVFYRFVLPSFSRFIVITSTLAEWLLLYFLESFFSIREKLFDEITNTDTKSMASVMYENSLFAGDADHSLLNARHMIFWSALILFCFIIISSLVGADPSKVTILISFIFYFLVIVSFIVITAFRDEQKYSSLGLPEIFLITGKRLKKTIIPLIVCTVTGILFSTNKALLDGSFILRFLKWLVNLFNRNYENSHEYFEHSSRGAVELPPPIQEYTPETEPRFVIPWMLIFKCLLIAAFIAAVVYFLIIPLFSKKLKTFFTEKRLSKYFHDLLAKIRRFFALIFGKKMESLFAETESSRRLSKAIRDILMTAAKSKAKKREIDKLTSLFLQLADWAENHGVPYYDYMAPAEYTTEITERLFTKPQSMPQPTPQTETDASMQESLSQAETVVSSQESLEVVDSLSTIGRLFEQALYARELLTNDEQNEYKQAIMRVIRIFTV